MREKARTFMSGNQPDPAGIVAVQVEGPLQRRLVQGPAEGVDIPTAGKDQQLHKQAPVQMDRMTVGGLPCFRAIHDRAPVAIADATTRKAAPQASTVFSMTVSS